ncbi:hypothetical protein ASC80_05775 [Afipia sp. Root123D2]|uniref:hypothetical protein n=1 Tax=Afipia sp. Root123D2 TaxID=1736436 RepID=UPI0006F40662|nr:hypothetical protein [Afipia sp. Root123D2]KQW22849.1 hypothetical protein ASC80_05775 [Afipia sp. Root123D2]
MKIIAAAFLATVTSAFAQTVVDESGSGINPVAMESAKSAITWKLRDPISAQIKGVRLIHTSELRPDVLCGYINAKNGYGGYVGFKPFYYEVKRNLGGVVQDTSNELERLPFEWSGCAKALGK